MKKTRKQLEAQISDLEYRLASAIKTAANANACYAEQARKSATLADELENAVSKTKPVYIDRIETIYSDGYRDVLYVGQRR